MNTAPGQVSQEKTQRKKRKGEKQDRSVEIQGIDFSMFYLFRMKNQIYSRLKKFHLLQLLRL